MNDLSKRMYRGDGKCYYKPLSGAWQQPEPYIASKSLAEAVNIALYLRRPLLLEGEPGCGKTRLAYAIAYELGYPIHTCYIRSTSQAQDLLYSYQPLARFSHLQESQTASNCTESLLHQEPFILGGLGEAIRQSQNNIPSVVLIDEIDKADTNFANDLLLELDRLQFQVKELLGIRFDALKGKKRQERSEFLPLIIITSNRERELPQPFLRRCLFYYTDFPDQATIKRIIKCHFQTEITPLFDVALKKIWKLRELKSWQKMPSTSEFLDWVTLLERDERVNKITPEELWTTPLNQLPYLETLVKTQSEREALNKVRM